MRNKTVLLDDGKMREREKFVDEKKINRNDINISSNVGAETSSNVHTLRVQFREINLANDYHFEIRLITCVCAPYMRETKDQTLRNVTDLVEINCL